MTGVDGECRTQRVALPGGAATWTVLGPDLRGVAPAEQFLEYLRVQGTSPNTVKSYARALALWWTYLSVFGLAWDALTLAEVGGFLAWLRSGDGPQVVSIGQRPARFAESTITTRLRAVTSCYRFHELNGVALGGDLARVVHGGRAVHKPMLEHVARGKGRRRAVIRVRTSRRAGCGVWPGVGSPRAQSRPRPTAFALHVLALCLGLWRGETPSAGCARPGAVQDPGFLHSRVPTESPKVRR